MAGAGLSHSCLIYQLDGFVCFKYTLSYFAFENTHTNTNTPTGNIRRQDDMFFFFFFFP